MKSLIFRFLSNFELYVCQFLLALLVTVMFLDLLLRNFFNYSIPWGSELSVYANVWFAYFGASYAASKFLHNRITTHFVFFPPIVKKISLIISDIVWVIFNLVFLYYSYDFVFYKANSFWTSQTLNIPMKWIYIILPLGFALITIRVIQAALINLLNQQNTEKDLL